MKSTVALGTLLVVFRYITTKRVLQTIFKRRRLNWNVPEKFHIINGVI